MPITSTIQQGTLSLAAVTPGNSAIGDAAAAGTSASVARADHKHGREASGTPGASAVGDTASTGSATTVALSDHRHSREAFGTPVNIDASLTSLSTGSLTTVARADHVHTVSNVPVLIASSTFATNTLSITYSNIPQTYRNLRLLISGLSTLSASYDSIQAQYNGVTTSSYYSGATTSYVAFAYVGVLNAATSNWPTTAGTSNVQIFNYSDTTTKKVDTSSSWATITAGNSNYAQIAWFNQFDNTSAITSIKLFFNSGASFKSGTKISLYGEP